jgi:hypothetical protein
MLQNSKNVKCKFITVIFGWNMFNYHELKLTKEEVKTLLPELKQNFPLILINGIPIPSEFKYSIKSSN